MVQVEVWKPAADYVAQLSQTTLFFGERNGWTSTGCSTFHEALTWRWLPWPWLDMVSETSVSICDSFKIVNTVVFMAHRMQLLHIAIDRAIDALQVAYYSVQQVWPESL
jgi:hypothetical protein